jgi:type IV pilus assembly protein PilZ
MSQPGGGDDDRAVPRAPIELRVEYQRLNTFFADYTKNICKGGTFIKTKKPLDVGTEFVFKLVIPHLGDVISLRGDVRWTHREGEDPPEGIAADHEPGMGIRFIYGDPNERMLVERTVEKLMVDSLGQLLYSKLMEQSRAEGGGTRGSDGGGPDVVPREPSGPGRTPEAASEAGVVADVVPAERSGGKDPTGGGT